MAMLVATVLFAACDDSDDNCSANVDCPGLSACVAGQCISDPAKCQNVGALESVTAVGLGEIAAVDEAHVTVDANGAVHACAYGQAAAGDVASVYLVQTSADAFSTTPISGADGVPQRCGAITVSRDGTPYLLSRSNASVMSLRGGAWTVVPLDGLEGVEAQGAVAGDRALITLTPDAASGVYLAMSLGFELDNQAIYLAHVDGPSAEVIVNGWSEDGFPTSVGHAPQLLSLSTGEVRSVLDDVGGFDVVFADQYLGAIATVEGVYGRAAAGANGAVRALYLDRNYVLRAADLDTGAFVELADLGAVAIDESADGLVPWELAVDGAGAAHILYEDQNQGADTVLYGRVLADGSTDGAVFASMNLATGLPGMQKYALGTDICGRATIAALEDQDQEQASADSGVSSVQLVVREGR